MNATIFITFFTYMLRQNVISFYERLIRHIWQQIISDELYAAFKLAPVIKIKPTRLLSYSPLNESHCITLQNSMHRTYRRAYHSLINIQNVLILWIHYPQVPVNIRHVFVKLHKIDCINVFWCLQINGKKNTTFQFSVKSISNKIHEAIFTLVNTQRQYVDRLY